MTLQPDLHWAAIVPVKELAVAKTRLGLPDGPRQDLALAMASDVVDACLGCGLVAGVMVVTNDSRAASELAVRGGLVVPDAPDAGLNPALVDGARLARGWWPRAAIVAVSSDLPALTSAELARVLERAARHRCAMVADADGRGTTVLTGLDLPDFRPAFGPGSRHRHTTGGAYSVDSADAPGAGRDVDTLADLRDAARLGLGRATRGTAETLGLLPPG